MAFIGVRISWDMRERKSVFARPISSTFSSFISIMRLRTFDTDTTMTMAPTNRHSTSPSATTSRGFSDTMAWRVRCLPNEGMVLREKMVSSSSWEKLFTALLMTEYSPVSTGCGKASERLAS